MTCAIFGENFDLRVLGTGANPESQSKAGSALQNPDIQRAQLGALLRRRPASPQGNRSFWQAFTSYYAATCANSNG